MADSSKVRRTVAKLKSSTGVAHDSRSESEMSPPPSKSYEQDEDGKPHPHPQVEDVVNTIGYSLIQEIMQYLKGPDGEAAMECILDTQSKVLSRLATTQEARQASRVAAQEFMVGSYDAAQQKWLRFCNSLPRSAPFFAILAACYVLFFALGLLLTCWRFAFFGLH